MNPKLVPLDEPILRRLRRKVDSGTFYGFAEIRHPGRASTWKKFCDLTVGDCEQLVEYHVRRVHKFLPRFWRTGSERTAETIADHMFRACRYRYLYHQLLGIPPRPEDFVFSQPVSQQSEGDDDGP